MKLLATLAMFAFVFSGLSEAQNGTAPELVVQPALSETAVGRVLSFSPDGRWLATADADSILLWEVATGRVWRTFHSDHLSFCFSPQGDLLASGEEGAVRVWQVTDGRLLHNFPTGPRGIMGTGDVAFGADGKILASVTSGEKVVRIWQLAGERQIQQLSHAAEVRRITISRNGRWLAASTFDYTVSIWDTASWTRVQALRLGDKDVGKTNIVESLPISFSSDSSKLVAGGGATVQVWETGSWRELRTVHDPQVGNMISVRFSPDGQQFAAVGFQDVIKVWKTSDMGPETFSAPGEPALDFSPDGRWLAAPSRGEGYNKIHLWELAHRGRRTFECLSAPFSGISLSHDGSLLAAATRNDVRIWNLTDTGDTPRLFHLSTRGSVNRTGVRFSPDGRRLAAIVQVLGLSPLERFASILFLHDVETGETREVAAFGAGNNRIAWSPDSRWLAASDVREKGVGEWDKYVHVFDIRNGDQFFLDGSADALAFSPDSSLLVSASSDGKLTSWDTFTRRPLHRYEPNNIKSFDAVAFHPKGRVVVAGTFHDDPVQSEAGLVVWDAESGTVIKKMSLASGRESVTAIAFSPDGSQFATSVAGRVQIWETESIRLVRTIESGGDDLVYTSDGRVLVSLGTHSEIHFWDPASGREFGRLVGHQGTTDWVAATPDGLFDGSALGSANLFAWRIGNQTFAPDQFYVDYNTPGLLRRLANGESLRAARPIGSLRQPPEVHIAAPAPGASFAESRIPVKIEITEKGAKLSELRLYLNGKLIEARRVATTRNPVYSFDVELAGGQNTIKAVALSTENVESNQDSLPVFCTVGTGIRGDLHVLAVGINQYEDSRFRLRFASDDAEAMARFFEQSGTRLFGSVHIQKLLDSQATRSALLQALDQLSAKAKREDVVLIYLAGHGTTVGQQFYFLTEEMRAEPDEEAAVRKYGLPAAQIGDTLRSIRALKVVLVIDTCESGAALPQLAKALSRGVALPGIDKAVQILARSTGVHMLAAATQSQSALEIGPLGHGALTYAILDALGNKEKPKALTTDGMVTVLSLLQFVTREVEDLTKKYYGKAQTPVFNSSGADFPLWSR